MVVLFNVIFSSFSFSSYFCSLFANSLSLDALWVVAGFFSLYPSLYLEYVTRGKYNITYFICSLFPPLSCGLLLFRVDSKKINRLNLRSTIVLAFLWFKFCRSTLESCFCVDFRFYHFSFIIFMCWTLDLNFLPKYWLEKKNTKI